MEEFKHGEKVLGSRYSWGTPHMPFRYRCGSVPGIRKWRCGGRCYKKPPHRYEESNAYIADEEVFTILTPRQITQIEKYRWVPDPWEDIPRRFYGHTWKRHRKTRYK